MTYTDDLYSENEKPKSKKPKIQLAVGLVRGLVRRWIRGVSGEDEVLGVTMGQIQVQYSMQMTIWDCPYCGMLYGVTKEYEARRRADARPFYCPDGHSQSFKESDYDRLNKKQKETEQARIKAEQEILKARAEIHRQQQKMKKVRARVGRGVCPCCNRSFEVLERHMATKHPDYKATNVTQLSKANNAK